MPTPFDTAQQKVPNIFDTLGKGGGQGQNSGSPMPDGFPQRPPLREQLGETGNAMYSNQVPGQVVRGAGTEHLDDVNAGASRQGASPLDRYVEIQDNSNSGDAAAKKSQSAKADQQLQEDKDFFDTLSMQTLQERISKSDFTKSLDQELVQKALGGDAQAFSQVLNTSMQQAVAMATFGGAKLAGVGVGQRLDRFRSDLPNQLRERDIQNSWESDKDSILSHPSVVPLREAAVQMLRKQHPNANPQELKSKTEQYFQDLFTAQNQGMQHRQAQQQAESSGAANFADFFSDL